MKRTAIFLVALALPAAALADSWEPNWGTNNRGTSNYRYYQHDTVINRDGNSWQERHDRDRNWSDRDRDWSDRDRDRDWSDRDRDWSDRDRDRDWRGKKCPPGLAKKGNGCLPPGQAKKH